MAKSAQIFFDSWLGDAMMGPTPVSALLHAATMVKRCRFISKDISLLFCYMLGKPFNEFINTLKIYKKISVFLMVNQQVTFSGTSETLCKMTFLDYSKPSHFKSLNKPFLEWFIGFTEGLGEFKIINNKIFFEVSHEEIQLLYKIKKI